jgi:hypothetical protein
MKTKLKIGMLEVSSFITNLNKIDPKTINGAEALKETIDGNFGHCTNLMGCTRATGCLPEDVTHSHCTAPMTSCIPQAGLIGAIEG